MTEFAQRNELTPWFARVMAAATIVTIVWCIATSWPAIVHGHPAYGTLLGLTVLGSLVVGWRSRSSRPAPNRWRRAARLTLIVCAIGWIALLLWLRPFSAVDPAVAAMHSDGRVSVADYPTQIVLTPTESASTTAVFFQPGAKVEARAYVAILRPLAEAGHLVVIPKQPFGIGFLSTGAFENTRAAYPQITGWVVGGHSLGGTVAAMDARDHDRDLVAPVVGLLFYASYPASDLSGSLISPVLSISASNDGLATPAKVEASRARLPSTARFTTIVGAAHSSFGDYGPQPGDGTPTINAADARRQIATKSVEFVAGLNN